MATRHGAPRGGQQGHLCGFPLRCGGTRVLTGPPASAPVRSAPPAPQGPASWEPRGRSQTLPTALGFTPCGPGAGSAPDGRGPGASPVCGTRVASGPPPTQPPAPWTLEALGPPGPCGGTRLAPHPRVSRPGCANHHRPRVATPGASRDGNRCPRARGPSPSRAPSPGLGRVPGRSGGCECVLGLSWASPGSQRPGCGSEERAGAGSLRPG